MDDKETSYTLGKHSVKAGSKDHDEHPMGRHSKEYLGKHSKENLTEKERSSSVLKDSDFGEGNKGVEEKDMDVEEILTSLKQENPASKDTVKFKKVSSDNEEHDGSENEEQDELEVADVSRRLIISKKASDLFAENERVSSKNALSKEDDAVGKNTAERTNKADAKSTDSADTKSAGKASAASNASNNESASSASNVKSANDTNEDVSQEEMIEKRRQGLKRILIIAIALLVVLALVSVCVAISLSNNSQTNNNSVLTPNEQPEQVTVFSPIKQDALPSFAAYFGKPLSELTNAYDKRIVLNGDKAESGDPDIPALVSLQHAYLQDEKNANIATLAFGLDANDTLVYVYCMADLDAMHVADASFEKLLSDKTLPVSFLVACGIKQGVANTAALTQQEKPSCINDAKAQEGAENSSADMAFFTGNTGQSGVPQTWKLTEKYDDSIGKTLGDNSVLRTITVELY